MKLLKSGVWWISSKTDPRWNCDGHTDKCGGFIMPKECQDMIEYLKKSLGEPPEDLEYNYMKD